MENSFLRLRVYNTDGHGVMMSLFDVSSFKIIESRYTDSSFENLTEEMNLAGCSTIDSLTISNWNNLYCSADELKKLLDRTQPTALEIPAASPQDDDSKECKKIVNVFCDKSLFAEKFEAGPKSLLPPMKLEDKEFCDVILGPLEKYGDYDSNSIVKLYWTGRFTILNTSLCKKQYCANDLKRLLGDRPLDVLVVSSVAENEFIQSSFLTQFNPACIIEVGKDMVLYTKKDNTAELRGIHILHLESGDFVLYSGFYKKNSNIFQGETTADEAGQYAKTERKE